MDEGAQISDVREEAAPIVHIDNFEGPLDLLWDLIKKARIDITEVSISLITEQYLAYLRLMETLNVRVASDFIEMASELLLYKSRALLPSVGIEDEYFVPPLPPELVQRLLEFKKYQQASRMLLQEFDARSERFSRENRREENVSPEEYIDVTLFDLLKAFVNVLERSKEEEQQEILFDEIMVSDMIERIGIMLAERDVVHFQDIFPRQPSRMEIVVALLAILEMARTRIIRLMQNRLFATIRITKAA